jgi:hypothetical protein
VSAELTATCRKKKTDYKVRLKKFKPDKILFEERGLNEETDQQNIK